MGLRLGAYLYHPVTDKHSHDEENNKMIYGVSSMQGWRETQEVSFVIAFILCNMP